MDFKSLEGYLIRSRYPTNVAAFLSNGALWTLRTQAVEISSFLAPSMLTWFYRLHRFLQHPGSKTRAIGKQENYTQNFKEK